MLSAVQFDDQLGFDTGEISEISIDRNLTAKLESIKLTIAQNRPELAFGVRLIAAQSPGAACSVT